MNKLDEIIKKYEPCINSDEFAKAVALEFAKHILKEAAENAKMYNANEDCHYEAEDGTYPEDYRIDKKLITDTLNKYL